MWLTRYALPFVAVVATLLAWLAPEKDTPPERISARAVIGLAQAAGGGHYTFSQATAARLAAVEIERPAANLSLESLESCLRAAGFTLQANGTPERRRVRVEATGS